MLDARASRRHECPQCVEFSDERGNVFPGDAENGTIARPERLAMLDGVFFRRAIDSLQHDMRAAPVERHDADARTARTVIPIAQPRLRAARHVKATVSPRRRQCGFAVPANVELSKMAGKVHARVQRSNLLGVAVKR